MQTPIWAGNQVFWVCMYVCIYVLRGFCRPLVVRTRTGSVKSRDFWEKERLREAAESGPAAPESWHRQSARTAEETQPR